MRKCRRRAEKRGRANIYTAVVPPSPRKSRCDFISAEVMLCALRRHDKRVLRHDFIWPTLGRLRENRPTAPGIKTSQGQPGTRDRMEIVSLFLRVSSTRMNMSRCRCRGMHSRHEQHAYNRLAETKKTRQGISPPNTDREE